jgi:protein TonB
MASAAAQQAPLQKRQEPRPKAKSPVARPTEEAKEPDIPRPDAQQPQLSQVSFYGKEVSGSTPQVEQVSGPTSAAVDERAGGNSAGSGDMDGTLKQAKAAYLKEHFAYIRDRIIRSILYPPMARKMGWCGRVKIAFVVCEDGGVNDVRVVESSGFDLLDRNTVNTVKNVAPFPRPPAKAEIRMAITYRLD